MRARKKTEVNTPKATPDAEPVETKETGVSSEAGFPIVGIGASAGGLTAFESFFSGMPADTNPNMAFVIVQHLAPDHKSILTDLIQRCTRLQVFEVEDGMVVQQNCAYIIPPNRDMAFLNGALHLMEPLSPRGQRLPIDFFFRSLAQDQHERAICVILSGTGSDGTLGLKAIKGEGGMAMVQDPTTTEYDGMPNSAIGTGIVDYVLPSADMVGKLISYVAHAFGKPTKPAAAPLPKIENAQKKIIILVRVQTGHDFSQYKPSTVGRCIERRMAVHQIDSMEKYVRYLQQTPKEIEALFRDLLIGVTSFFRDSDAFKALEDRVIPKLFDDKPANAAIRIWSLGCSTGEEAYSIAMLLKERMEEQKKSYRVQIFATDIDSRAIAVARAGIYPASIVSDISLERWSRYFASEAHGSAYRIHKSIRDMIVFSEQDMIKDPPFSKLDLITCRNVLIYMGGSLQNKIIPLFHYALNPGGYLFLGTSETVGEFNDLFITLDRRSKIYQRNEGIHSERRTSLGRFQLPIAAIDTASPYFTGKMVDTRKLSPRELTEKELLQHVAPAGALVNGQGDIIYLHGRTGLFLEPAPGETGVNNIMKMAREGLQRELHTALHRAVETNEIVRYSGLRVKTNGDFTAVNLTIRPVMAGTDEGHDLPLYFVIFEVNSPLDPASVQAASAEQTGQGDGGSDASVGLGAGGDADARIAALMHDLRTNEEYLRTSNEELETANEELESSNEELQSVNEELQSTNEELETSKEELQSMNEELATVNAELQTKLADLSQVNNDMNNLLAGTGIGTIFVNHQLRILRFTPFATQIINLIQSDVGRPVGHVVTNLVGYDHLVEDLHAVLDTLIPIDKEVQTQSGEWFTMRILPYRTLDNVIEGAVITFVNITETKKAQQALREIDEWYHALYEDSPNACFISEILNDHSLRIIDCNHVALKMLRMTDKKQVLGKGFVALSPKRQSDGRLSSEKFEELINEAVAKKSLRFEWELSGKDGETVHVENQVTVLEHHGKMVLYSIWSDFAEGREVEQKQN